MYPRSLTAKERLFTRWLIENAKCSDEEKKRYLSQLNEATVVRMCKCGCASIDFAIAGAASEQFAPLTPFGDFISKDKRVGVFIFSKCHNLAGVEIYSLDGETTPAAFPDTQEFEPVAWNDTGFRQSHPARHD